MKRMKWFIGLLAVAAFSLALGAGSTTAQAKAINYQALRYHTNQTSMASGYFVKPASVKVSHHKYVVTMHIRTAKKLSSYPVKVLSVNGGAAKHVRRVKDHAGNSNLYYSFTTTNLKKRINAKLAIDVPKVYKATHLISFKFSTKGLPSLKGKAAATAATAKVTGAAATTQKKQSNGKASDNNGQQPQENKVKQLGHNQKKGHKAVNSQKPAAKASSASSNTASDQTAKQPANSAKTASTDKKDHSNTGSRLPFLIVGVVVIIAVVVGGSYIVMKKKE
ncbi:cell surface protein [Secundilactobacillus pentosiphilus]|uniref:Cell surface protein n=1 Tax=Secundilactobacillus pentosiphilus TaxID=1714682 RepID=A0A1Z5IVI0_9LACO|nr:NEAT domain-containing protein [Secundilactobacillus pentosiphilus]GAX05753.1 cell surface protein [Secundilactobacillus pentosiphilus]